MNNSAIERLVIVGGGTAGWMTAASLASHFSKTPMAITLVESSAIGTIGVGEATIPSIRRFYGALGLKDAEVLKRTQATAKLAIQFDGWRESGHSFFHPFGVYGQDVRQVGFHHYWLRMHREGLAGDIGDYSLAVALAQSGKFTPPAPNPPTPLSVFDWALHFDASLFAALMKDTALSLGVEAVDARIDSVRCREPDGFISELVLDSGKVVAGDLFIDCSGFRGLLIEGALQTGFDDWGEWLHCDRAVALQSELDDPEVLPPYTRSIAHSAGWQWKIPLQHRQGNGYVYSSQFISDDEALATLRENVAGAPRTEPNIIPFRPGRRRQAWRKNCIAVGLAAGFLEPLESTSIALIETAIDKIKLLFPDKNCVAPLVDEFNDMTALEYERVRDFIILHYKLNGRSEPFWQRCRDSAVPDTLQHKMDLFRERGHLVKYRWEIFQNASWVALYMGLGLLPARYDPATEYFDTDYLKKAFAQMRQSLGEAAAAAPAHAAFLAQEGIRT